MKLSGQKARGGFLACAKASRIIWVQQKIREKTLEQIAEKAAQLDVQAFNVARASMALLAKQFIEGAQDGSLSLADRERLLRMCDMAHKMGRRALGVGDTSP